MTLDTDPPLGSMGRAYWAGLADADRASTLARGANPVRQVEVTGLSGHTSVKNDVSTVMSSTWRTSVRTPSSYSFKRSQSRSPSIRSTGGAPVSYTHLRAHETDSYLVCRLL